MNTVKHRLRLELSPRGIGSCRNYDGPVMIRRGDDMSHELIVSLRNAGEPYVITDDVSVYMYAVGPEGDRYLDECTVENNEIRLTLKSSMLERSDTVLEFKLVGKNGETLGTPALRIVSMGSEAYETAGREFAAIEDYSALLRALRRAEDSAIASVHIDGGDLIVTYGDGTWHNAGRVKGEKGENGEKGNNGAKWHCGTLVSGSGSGIMMPVSGATVGDYYLNSNTGEVYTATNGGEIWKYLLTLAGEKGDAGEAGPAGTAGTKWYYGSIVSGTGNSIMAPVAGANTGDFYLNSNTGNVYVSTEKDVWWKYVMCLKA